MNTLESLQKNTEGQPEDKATPNLKKRFCLSLLSAFGLFYSLWLPAASPPSLHSSVMVRHPKQGDTRENI